MEFLFKRKQGYKCNKWWLFIDLYKSLIDSLGKLAIINGGHFRNRKDGTIHLSRIQLSILGAGGISTSGLFENMGLIHINDCQNLSLSIGDGSTLFTNSGTIQILNSYKGITAGGKMVNEIGGNIRLTDVALSPLNDKF